MPGRAGCGGLRYFGMKLPGSDEQPAGHFLLEMLLPV